MHAVDPHIIITVAAILYYIGLDDFQDANYFHGYTPWLARKLGLSWYFTNRWEAKYIGGKAKNGLKPWSWLWTWCIDAWHLAKTFKLCGLWAYMWYMALAPGILMNALYMLATMAVFHIVHEYVAYGRWKHKTKPTT